MASAQLRKIKGTQFGTSKACEKPRPKIFRTPCTHQRQLTAYIETVVHTVVSPDRRRYRKESRKTQDRDLDLNATRPCRAEHKSTLKAGSCFAVSDFSQNARANVSVDEIFGKPRSSADASINVNHARETKGTLSKHAEDATGSTGDSPNEVSHLLDGGSPPTMGFIIEDSGLFDVCLDDDDNDPVVAFTQRTEAASAMANKPRTGPFSGNLFLHMFRPRKSTRPPQSEPSSGKVDTPKLTPHPHPSDPDSASASLRALNPSVQSSPSRFRSLSPPPIVIAATKRPSLKFTVPVETRAAARSSTTGSKSAAAKAVSSESSLERLSWVFGVRQHRPAKPCQRISFECGMDTTVHVLDHTEEGPPPRSSTSKSGMTVQANMRGASKLSISSQTSSAEPTSRQTSSGNLHLEAGEKLGSRTSSKEKVTSSSRDIEINSLNGVNSSSYKQMLEGGENVIWQAPSSVMFESGTSSSHRSVPSLSPPLRSTQPATAVMLATAKRVSSATRNVARKFQRDKATAFVCCVFAQPGKVVNHLSEFWRDRLAETHRRPPNVIVSMEV